MIYRIMLFMACVTDCKLLSLQRLMRKEVVSSVECVARCSPFQSNGLSHLLPHQSIHSRLISKGGECEHCFAPVTVKTREYSLCLCPRIDVIAREFMASLFLKLSAKEPSFVSAEMIVCCDDWKETKDRRILRIYVYGCCSGWHPWRIRARNLPGL